MEIDRSIHINDADAQELWPDADGKNTRREYPLAYGRELLYIASRAREVLADADPKLQYELGLNVDYYYEQQEYMRRIGILDAIIFQLKEVFGPIPVGDEAERYLRSLTES